MQPTASSPQSYPPVRQVSYVCARLFGLHEHRVNSSGFPTCSFGCSLLPVCYAFIHVLLFFCASAGVSITCPMTITNSGHLTLQNVVAVIAAGNAYLSTDCGTTALLAPTDAPKACTLTATANQNDFDAGTLLLAVSSIATPKGPAGGSVGGTLAYSSSITLNNAASMDLVVSAAGTIAQAGEQPVWRVAALRRLQEPGCLPQSSGQPDLAAAPVCDLQLQMTSRPTPSPPATLVLSGSTTWCSSCQRGQHLTAAHPRGLVPGPLRRTVHWCAQPTMHSRRLCMRLVHGISWPKQRPPSLLRCPR